jgi:hypothetical protein
MVATWQRDLNSWLEESDYPATMRLRGRLGGALAIDGIFGPRTEAATVRFQQEGHNRADGVVGLMTWTNWIGSNVTCCGAGVPKAAPGEGGPDVGWWQLGLNR